MVPYRPPPSARSTYLAMMPKPPKQKPSLGAVSKKKKKVIKKTNSKVIKFLKENCENILSNGNGDFLESCDDVVPKLTNIKKKKTHKTNKSESISITQDKSTKSIGEMVTYTQWCSNIKLSQDSVKIGKETFEWMISPLPLKEFYQKYWEKKPLLLKRSGFLAYKGLLSTKDIDKMLRMHNIQFTKNIDVTSYVNGKRETHNLDGRALATSIWEFYNNGCSIRMLNPQTFYKPVWLLLSTLQEYFQSFCGANVYLTPPDSQGFAPHYDDIEAFILQLEGKKRWRVYSPRNQAETLPRESSRNFGPDDVLPVPILDVILEAGDLLYFPRGFIHQGEALDGAHSLHITISTYQKTSYVDLLEKLLPKALAQAAEKDVEFRRGLPIHYLGNGSMASRKKSSLDHQKLQKKVTELVSSMMEDSPLHEAIDEMAQEFIHASLPPVLSDEEKLCSALEGGERWDHLSKSVVNRVELSPDTLIRFARKHCCRLSLDDLPNSIRLYYNIENSREYKKEEAQYLEIDEDVLVGVEALIKAYPRYIEIESLPLKTLDDKLSLANGLWEKCLLVTKQPLPNMYADDE